MTNIKLDKVQMVIVAKKEGEKYWFFLGEHYKAGHSCYDVAILNKVNGVIMKLHFANKDECIFKWDELMKKFNDMVERRARGEGVEDEDKLIVIN